MDGRVRCSPIAARISNIVEKIGGGFYSHHFPLTRRDVTKDLGLIVEEGSPDFWDAIEKAQEYYDEVFGHQVGADGHRKVAFNIAGFIECDAERRVLVHAEAAPTKPDAKDALVVQRWVRPKVGTRPNGAPFDFAD